MKHRLTETAIAKARPRGRPYRLADGENLYLLVSVTGVKSWQLRYRSEGRPQTATLGKYPATSLAEARRAADRARELVDAGQHLTVAKRLARARQATEEASTFEALARDWILREARRMRWTPAYRIEVERSVENHLRALYPVPVAQLTAAVAAPALRAVEARAPAMLEKVRPRLLSILDYAVELGQIATNPLPRRLHRVRGERRHYPAVTDLDGVGAILRAARAGDPSKGVSRAHTLLVFTALRVSEVTGACWPEFDLAAGTWSVPRERMKRRDAVRGPHLVPLPRELLAQLVEWKAVDGKGAIYVCPAPRSPASPITPEAVEKFYRRTLELGGRHSPHSWRSAFSTICREHGHEADLVEAQLDHVVGNKVSAAYDRAARLDRRRNLMQWYESTLLAARDGARLFAIPSRA